jgi:hypothetical protein
MVDNMPDVLVAPAIDVAHEAVDNALYEEEQVEQFMAEVDEFNDQ